MSRIIYVQSRTKLDVSIDKKLADICNVLLPDNIQVRKPRIYTSASVAYGIVNPNDTVLTDNTNVLLGQLIGNNINWHRPLSPNPDGSYAIFRNDGEYCEILADPAASRTVWYYFDSETLVASTSQRAIIMYLKSFEFNPEVISWMISSGTLGPGLSWDRRLNHLGPESALSLDISKWGS